MKLMNFPLAGITMILVATGCSKNNDASLEGLPLNNRTTAYTSVTETLTTKLVNTAVLRNIDGSSGAISFDTHQAWFDFTKIDATITNSGKASYRDGWTLAFWNGTENKAILNYSVNTQAVRIAGELYMEDAIYATSALNKAYDSIYGGTLGMGAMSTFDFHKEGQFAIGTVWSENNQVFMIRTAPVQVHPDTTGSAPVSVELWLAEFLWTGSNYYLKYRPVLKSGSSWSFNSSILAKTHTIAKNTANQYQFVKFGTGAVTVQPPKNEWNLGLSAVVLKRYMNPDFGGGSYPFAVKGVVLNNNTDVKIYAVKATTGGAPGPFDPNFTFTGTDPALTTSNESAFNAFTAANIVDANFSSTSQEEIGQYWRHLDMGNYNIFTDRFYVIKLANGHVYKLKFDNLSSTSTTNAVNSGIKYRFAKIATP